MLYLDTETRSAVSLTTRGLFPYIECPHFGVTLVPWAINEGDVEIWEPMREQIPAKLERALLDESETVVFHNSKFDRRVMSAAGICDISINRVWDTMVQAYCHGLPGGLGQLSEIFKLGDDGKDAEGKRLIQLFCMPIKFRKTKHNPNPNPNNEVVFNDWNSHPEEWEKFKEYAKRDIISMRKLSRMMPQINYPVGFDRTLWQYDQKMNDRGIRIDIEMADSATVAFELEKRRSRQRVQKITNGEVTSSSEGQKIIAYLNNAFDLDIDNIRKESVRTLLENDDLPYDAKMLLIERSEASKTTPAKYKTLLNKADRYGFIHDTIQFAGASRTGRDSGRDFQPQNLMRPTRWKKLSGDALSAAIELDIALLKNGAYEVIEDDVIDFLSNLIRSVIIPKDGNKMCVADLSNIEGRVLVWLAGEAWKVQYFRDYDAGKVEFDNYVMAYARAMNCAPEEVDSAKRAIGKVMELALGYGGGVAAFITFAAVYRLDLEVLAKAVKLTAVDVELFNYCEGEKYDWAKANRYHAGLPRHIYAAGEYLKVKWREAHPMVVAFWKNLEECFRQATRNPGINFAVPNTGGKIIFKRVKSWLYMRLPSGRVLCYLHPMVHENNSLSFMGVNQTTKRFERIKTYGGKLSENATSATAREVMFHNIPKVEEMGFEIDFRVHDEFVAEIADSSPLDHTDLETLMSTPHVWCKDLPLAASGFTSHRYRGKD